MGDIHTTLNYRSVTTVLGSYGKRGKTVAGLDNTNYATILAVLGLYSVHVSLICVALITYTENSSMF